jgi:Arrestin (or S-antigen), N-terminal domain
MDLIANVHLPDIGDIQLWSTAKADHLKPGQELLGYVKFSPIKSVFVRGVWVKLAGFNTLHLANSPRGDVERFDLLMSDEDHFLGGVHDVLLGLGEEEEIDRNTDNDGALLQLDEGNHVWNFSFKLPLNAPLSFCDKNVEILYTATATVDIPGIPIVISQVHLAQLRPSSTFHHPEISFLSLSYAQQITHNVIVGYSSSRQIQSSMSSSGVSNPSR